MDNQSFPLELSGLPLVFDPKGGLSAQLTLPQLFQLAEQLATICNNIQEQAKAQEALAAEKGDAPASEEAAE